MKKFICLILCLAMLFTFAACGEGNTGSTSSTESEIPGTEGLEYTLLSDGTYSVSAGTAKYLSEIVIPSKYQGKAVTTIADEAFFRCDNLTSIEIPSSVTSIGNNVFGELSEISIYITDLAAWCNISWGFEQLYFPYRKLYLNEEIFTNLVFPNGVTSIGDRVFSECISLTSITIPNSVTSIGYGAFANCTALTSITIPNSVTSIGDYAFAGCTGLTSITISDSVTNIGEGVFCNCKSLTDIIIPNGVTSIGNYAFANCTALTSVTIPNSITSIAEDAFPRLSPSDAIRTITYQGSKSQWEQLGYNRGRNVAVLCTDGYYGS